MNNQKDKSKADSGLSASAFEAAAGFGITAASILGFIATVALNGPKEQQNPTAQQLTEQKPSMMAKASAPVAPQTVMALTF